MAYFVVAEGLANVAKHVGHRVLKCGWKSLTGELVISVEDDGIGGADPDNGSGLRGLVDRTEALGGRLSLSNGCPNRNLAYRFTPADRCLVSYSAGSVNKLLPIPGLAEYGHGFRTIPEAIDLHDHHPPAGAGCSAVDAAERRARWTFVVVGAGYTGTEVAAQGQLMTTRLARTLPGLAGQEVRWMLLDLARGCCPGSMNAFQDRRSGAATARRRGEDRPVGCRGQRWFRSPDYRR